VFLKLYRAIHLWCSQNCLIPTTSAFIDMSVNTMDVCTAFSWKQQTTKCKAAEDYELLTFIFFFHLFQTRTFKRIFYRPDAPSNQQCESTEENPMHRPQPVTWRHPFFVQHWTLEGRGVVSATLVPYYYVSQKRMFFFQIFVAYVFFACSAPILHCCHVWSVAKLRRLMECLTLQPA